MTIRGSLETFSLPELFQIIESGSKSGRLSFNPSIKNANSELQGTFELWFERGNFVAITNSLEYQSLIGEIQNNAWANLRDLVKTKHSCPENIALGTCFQQQNTLTSSQINSLFQTQVNALRQLFNVNYAWFKFEEVDSNTIFSNGERFPWKEMTGKQKKATELSLEAMRELSNWERFADDLPLGNSGLQKVVDSHDMQLVSLENHLWNTADGTVSLEYIAKETSMSLEKVQQTALSMIYSGLVEEVPVVNIAKIDNSSQFSSQTVLAKQSNVTTKQAVNTKVSNSLINNLVSFLRNNF